MSEIVSIAIACITGKMGMNLAHTAINTKFVKLTAATVSPNNESPKTIGTLLGVAGYDFLPKQQLEKCINDFDVLIDFSHPDATLKQLKVCSEYNKAIVIGTTGFNANQLIELKAFSEQIPIVFASNMSRGVNISLNLIKQLTKLIGHEADIEIIEAHHRHKKDAPSGTALTMGEMVANALGDEPLSDIASFGRNGLSESGRDKKIGFSAIRAGDIVGEHTVMFALPGETIEIKHVANSRTTFSEGALTAAVWLKDKRPGLYNMQDVLGLSNFGFGCHAGN